MKSIASITASARPVVEIEGEDALLRLDVSIEQIKNKGHRLGARYEARPNNLVPCGMCYLDLLSPLEQLAECAVSRMETNDSLSGIESREA